MAKGGRYGNSAGILAGVMVLIVAVGLLAAVVFAIKQCLIRLPVPTARPSTTTTIPTEPPEPTLAKNPYSPEDFVLDENGYMTCLAGESWLGVDVSQHQGQIDWQQVAQTDVKFAMVRLGYRGWGAEGIIRADSLGLENLQGAADAGLLVGTYFFSQAISEEEAVEEARFLLQLLDGRKLDMPVVFDWETVSSEDARTTGMDAKTLNACALAFCREIEAAGYEAMVYFNLDLARWKLDLLPLQQEGYDFWLAHYSDSLRYPNQIQMWQYSNEGAVPGIKTKVDLNLYFPG